MSLSRRLSVALAAFTALVLVAGAASVSSAAAPAATSVAVPGFVCTHTVKANGGFITDCDPAGAPSPTASPSPTLSPTPAPTTPSPTPVSPTPTTPGPSASTPTPPSGFPTARSVGIQIGWTPKSTFTGDMTIRTPGVYEDIRVNGSVLIRSTGVTLRRLDVVGGIIDTEYAGSCYATVVEDTTLRKTTTADSVASNGAIGPGGYTARRVAILDRAEGFRIGGRSDAGCGPVLIEDSYARIARPSDISCTDWHGDAVQGFDAPTATIRHSTLDARNNASCGTAGVFYGSAEQWGNRPLTVRGLLVFGGNTAYRPDTPHDTEGLRIVEGTYGAALGTDSSGNYTCRRATRWVDNAVSDAAGNVVRPITC